MGDLSSECIAWSERLTIEVSRVVVVRCLQPLVRMQVVNVMLFRSGMHDSHLHVVADIAVMHVGRIVGIQDLRGLSPEDQVAHCVGRVGRHVHDLRRVANCPRRKEELFILALGAVEHRPDAESVGQNLCTGAGQCHS